MKLEIEITEDAWVVENAKQANPAEFEKKLREAALSIASRILQEKLATLTNKDGKKFKDGLGNPYEAGEYEISRVAPSNEDMEDMAKELERVAKIPSQIKEHWVKEKQTPIEFSLPSIEASPLGESLGFNPPSANPDDVRRAGG